jgi:hypothetical protein
LDSITRHKFGSGPAFDHAVDPDRALANLMLGLASGDRYAGRFEGLCQGELSLFYANFVHKGKRMRETSRATIRRPTRAIEALI